MPSGIGTEMGKDLRIQSSKKGLITEARKAHASAYRWQRKWNEEPAFRDTEAARGKTKYWAYPVCCPWKPSQEYPAQPDLHFYTDAQNLERKFAFASYFKMAVMIRSRCLVPIFYPRSVLVEVFTPGHFYAWERVPPPDNNQTTPAEKRARDAKWGGLQYLSFLKLARTCCRDGMETYPSAFANVS
jgi:hypothetical protein